jgi:flagellar biosynthesis protein FliP
MENYEDRNTRLDSDILYSVNSVILVHVVYVSPSMILLLVSFFHEIWLWS